MSEDNRLMKEYSQFLIGDDSKKSRVAIYGISSLCRVYIPDGGIFKLI